MSNVWDEILKARLARRAELQAHVAAEVAAFHGAPVEAAEKPKKAAEEPKKVEPVVEAATVVSEPEKAAEAPVSAPEVEFVEQVETEAAVAPKKKAAKTVEE